LEARVHGADLLPTFANVEALVRFVEKNPQQAEDIIKKAREQGRLY